jgi:hypothetical protein
VTLSILLLLFLVCRTACNTQNQITPLLLLAHVQLAALLAKLAGIHGSWLSRLQGTAAALQHALRADLVAITALGGGGSEYVCLAAEGIGVPHMVRQPW